jgi:C_GCAxxG_C_C family probable redox protein
MEKKDSQNIAVILSDINDQIEELQTQLLFAPERKAVLAHLMDLTNMFSETSYNLDRLRNLTLMEEKIDQITPTQIEEIANRAEKIMEGSYSRCRFHCSESFVIAVGSFLFGEVNDQCRRMVTGLAGGVGGTHEEMCGALVGGILIIGALYGRARPTDDDQPAYQLSVYYREQFIEKMGGAKCHEFRDNGYGSDGHTTCGQLVSRAVKVFFEVLKDRHQVLEIIED